MTCDTCPRPKTAVLADERRVCTWCEAWRHECEARAVLALPHVEARRKYLEGVGKRRGLAARNGLEDTVRELWRRRQQVRAS